MQDYLGRLNTPAGTAANEVSVDDSIVATWGAGTKETATYCQTSRKVWKKVMVGDASPVRVAIIGAGSHAQEHLLPALKLISELRLVSISSRSEDKARQAAHRWVVDAWSTDWESQLALTNCDAAIVCATPQIHATAAEHALTLGLPIFVEKPPAPSTQSLRGLATLEKNSKARVMVGLNLLFSSTITHLAELLVENGNPRLISIKCLSSKPSEPIWGHYDLPRSIMMAVGIHGLSVARLFCPNLRYAASEITRISQNAAAISLGLAAPDGTRAIIECGNYANRFIFEVEIVTDRGVVLSMRNLRCIEMYRGPSALVHPTPTIHRKETTQYCLSGLDRGFEAAGYLSELSSFIAHIRTGSPVKSPISESLLLYEIIDQCLATSSAK